MVPSPGSRPHGLTEDSAGNIWYTGNGNATVGRLNPKTGALTEYPMPDPAARDPHTPIFDRKGTLWFTLQQANMVGKLNPQTGETRLVKMPTERSLPYGMVVDSRPRRIAIGADDIIWYADYSRRYLGRLDPSTPRPSNSRPGRFPPAEAWCGT